MKKLLKLAMFVAALFSVAAASAQSAEMTYYDPTENFEYQGKTYYSIKARFDLADCKGQDVNLYLHIESPKGTLINGEDGPASASTTITVEQNGLQTSPILQLVVPNKTFSKFKDKTLHAHLYLTINGKTVVSKYTTINPRPTKR